MKAGSFAFLAPAMLLAGVSIAHAQQPPPQAAPLPPAPAALSVPDPLAGFRPGPRDLYRSPDGSDRFQHLSRYPVPPPVVFPPVYFPGHYYYPNPYYQYVAPSETSMAETYRMSMAETYLRRQREAARGTLVLQDVPGSAQVTVDGFYVGLAEEFGPGGRVLTLEAGARHIELRAPGYETLTFSVRIEPNSTLRYRGPMQRSTATAKPEVAAAAPGATAAPAVARSFYVIPNCYAGDKPPTGVLPKGCDLKNLQTRK